MQAETNRHLEEKVRGLLHGPGGASTQCLPRCLPGNLLGRRVE